MVVCEISPTNTNNCLVFGGPGRLVICVIITYQHLVFQGPSSKVYYVITNQHNYFGFGSPGRKWLACLTVARETRPGRGLNMAPGWTKKKQKQVDLYYQVDPAKMGTREKTLGRQSLYY